MAEINTRGFIAILFAYRLDRFVAETASKSSCKLQPIQTSPIRATGKVAYWMQVWTRPESLDRT
ncbi:hypothetical protein LOC71_13375 [Rhodopirellula sp. JC740]|uniref:Uncharacterized protein n=1 Tax=Rhodopirellula halodulae TaxID=2894198 RepID=A0ABS8NI83_9BACT|nr:hypothetical protein [Rhodopirellula sp. JC740]MCC9643270.1 hypothetical protein [Rhodopirellula sp. JC740]